MAGRCIALSLMLGLTACLFAVVNPNPTPQESADQASPRPSITEATTAGAGGNLNSELVTTPAGGGGGGANHQAAGKVTTTARTTPTAGTAPASTVIGDRASAAPVTTPKAATLAMTTATSRTTPVMAPKVTNPARTSATPRTTPVMAPKVTTRAMNPAARVLPAPDRTGTFVLLFLLLLLLLISLCGACCRLRSYGGSGSYYPGQADKRLYVSPEEGEGGDGGPRPMGRAFLAAVRNLLARMPGSEGEEGQKDEEERVQLTPSDGESDGEAEDEQEEEGEEAKADGGPAKGGETDQSDSDDYSSLGGLDLRERAARAGGGEEDFPDPPSPSSDELLSDLHSFSGTASWTDTNHDVTAL